jgi:hypothetical protein
MFCHKVSLLEINMANNRPTALIIRSVCQDARLNMVWDTIDHFLAGPKTTRLLFFYFISTHEVNIKIHLDFQVKHLL